MPQLPDRVQAGHNFSPWKGQEIATLRKKKPRQEICAPLKWLCFILNFLIFIVGVTCLAVGIYLCTKDPRTIDEWADVVLNPAVVLILTGLTICVVSLCGLFGALRDNVFLLKTFALSVFFAYIFLVISTFVLFMLFYSDTAEGISAHSVLLYSIKKYHTNRNVADFVDYLQEQLECCGTSSSAQGFKDWQLNEQFKCNQTNPYPEKCGVPFSCCRKSVVSEAASSINPTLSPAMRSPQWSLQCWQNAQTKKEQELENDIHMRGCLQPLRAIFEKYAVHLGAVVAAIILPVCFGVCLSQCLARQIDYQHYLLEREEKRYERRKRRERRYVEQQGLKSSTSQIIQQNHTSSSPIHNSPQYPANEAHLMEQGLRSKKSTPPSFPPPPTPRNEADAQQLAAAIAASKKEYRKEERRRQRALSTSPLRQGEPTGCGRSSKTLDGERGRTDQNGQRKKRRASAAAVQNAMNNRTRFLQQSDFTGGRKEST